MIQAADAAPGTVRELAARACIGLGVAKRTASRLLASGHLVRLDGTRPARLARNQDQCHDRFDDLASAMRRMAARPT